jgi:predicted transcriptional regulator
MVDLVKRCVHRCRCNDCLGCSKGEVARDHRAINRVVALLDERQRRLFAGLLARANGHGGIVKIAEITGLSRTTIRRGIAELSEGSTLDAERIRQRGGGRKSVEKNSLPW